MAKRKKKRRNGKYVVGAVCVAGVIGLAGFLDFGGFGIGDGWGGFGSNSNDSGYSTNDNDANNNGGNASDNEDEDVNNNATTQIVTVEGGSIFHNGAEISLDQLSTLIADNSGATWELRSERAIAAVQDDVRSMLQQHGVSFTETTD